MAMNAQQAIDFAKSSAIAVFDYCADVNYGNVEEGDYRSFDDAIAGYRENIRDTLNDERSYEHEEAAFAAYDAKVAELKASRAA